MTEKALGRRNNIKQKYETGGGGDQGVREKKN